MAASPINCCAGKFIKEKLLYCGLKACVGDNCIALGRTKIDRTGVCHYSKFYLEINLININ